MREEDVRYLDKRLKNLRQGHQAMGDADDVLHWVPEPEQIVSGQSTGYDKGLDMF